ncbi:hypothetical protein M0Q28_04455 [Patescibacteria group bacterium]|jgi:hypothetical protein|nr:hypothetical protein [Patescibacteria group bacterium]
MTQYVHRIPDDRVELRGCKAAKPLQAVLSVGFAELFIPANEDRTDLPLTLTIRPVEPQAMGRREWTVPFPRGIRIEAGTLLRHRRKLKAASPIKLITQEGSIRRALERSMLDWIAPETRVRIYHFPKGHMDVRAEPKFRVEFLFANDVAGQWDGSVDLVEPFGYFTDLKSPFT